MNYLNDLRFINSQLPTERLALAKESAYWNDFECALEVLRHSRHADKSQVILLAHIAMLNDISIQVSDVNVQ